jgi:TolB-like protein/class 3 adenylate cyclase/Flp pilus assembly protein TadD
LAADIVGFSRLMDADEEGTYTALLAERSEVIDPRIKEFGGRIFKHLGDGFLAEFPTVMAATQFAMSLQEKEGRRAEGVPKDRQMKFRIGINLGDVIVDDDGDVFGDGVNVAARLEALAIPGGICISGPVYETVHKKLDVDFDDLGNQSVKNISTPVHAYDIRWPGEAGTPDERVVKPTAKPKPRGMIAGGAVVVATLIGLVLWQMNPFQPADEAALKNSIAVLPFVNMSDDASNEYFSDGISEELLNLLAKIPELRVIARTSSFAYKGTNTKIVDVARELNVTHVLEGSVRKAGDQLRITAQLIRASDSSHLWSVTYDRTLDNIFAIQDEIASAVVAQLKITLLGNAPRVQETDPEAYALVLQARYLVQQSTADGLEKAIALLEQALTIDPYYTAAWAGLARVYMSQTGQSLRPIDEGYTLAREAIDKALALDPEYAPAHESLARITMFYDRDPMAAAQHYERALALDPANTDSIFGAANMAAQIGRLDQAIALAEYAVARDPVNPVGVDRLGIYYLYAGRLDEAITSLRTALVLSPESLGTNYLINTALLLKGEPEAALEVIQKETSETKRVYGLVLAYHALGQTAASDAMLAELIEKYEKDSAYNIAYLLAFRGEADRAFEWLNKAVVYNDPGLSQIAIWPQFANIHNDPRWLPFLESIGRSPAQLAAIEFEVTLPE